MFGRKKKVVEVEKPKEKVFKIEFKKQTFEVGVTFIKVVLKDGRKFTTSVEGSFYQYVFPGGYGNKPEVGNGLVTFSETMAERFVANINSDFTNTLTDVQTNPTESVSGQVISAEIHDTMKFEKEFDFAYIVEE